MGMNDLQCRINKWLVPVLPGQCPALLSLVQIIAGRIRWLSKHGGCFLGVAVLKLLSRCLCTAHPC